MLLAAAADFNIDLGRSWMVGDGKNDVLAGQNAGVRPILISENKYDNIENVHSLLEAVDLILSEDTAQGK
jgi:D-glycero-D-manno-heptose 1,7-bisphosphate phosphatase